MIESVSELKHHSGIEVEIVFEYLINHRTIFPRINQL